MEAGLSIYLENFATSLGSREQLAIAEFADALLVIPKTLAVNAAKVCGRDVCGRGGMKRAARAGRRADLLDVLKRRLLKAGSSSNSNTLLPHVYTTAIIGRCLPYTHPVQPIPIQAAHSTFHSIPFNQRPLPSCSVAPLLLCPCAVLQDATDLVARLRAFHHAAQSQPDKKGLSQCGLDLLQGKVRVCVCEGGGRVRLLRGV